MNGLAENGGWSRTEAERHFDQWASVYEIHGPAEFVLSEAERLRKRYPKVLVAPLMYEVGTGMLHQVAI